MQQQIVSKSCGIKRPIDGVPLEYLRFVRTFTSEQQACDSIRRKVSQLKSRSRQALGSLLRVSSSSGQKT